MRRLLTRRVRFFGYLAAIVIVAVVFPLAVMSIENRNGKSWPWLVLDTGLIPTSAWFALGTWEVVRSARKSGFASLRDAIWGWIAIAWAVMWLIAGAIGTILGIVLFFLLLSDIMFGWPHFHLG